MSILRMLFLALGRYVLCIMYDSEIVFLFTQSCELIRLS